MQHCTFSTESSWGGQRDSFFVPFLLFICGAQG
jgi:hypothetical protein